MALKSMTLDYLMENAGAGKNNVSYPATELFVVRPCLEEMGEKIGAFRLFRVRARDTAAARGGTQA
jgi:hypothetical protein